MSLLSIEDVVHRYGDRDLLRGVSLHVAAGERVAIVGDNGSGKSTLLRFLAGVEVPDQGRRSVRRDVAVGHLPQVPELDPALSVREAVRSGLGAWQQAMTELDAVHQALAAVGSDAAAMDRLLRRQGELDARLETLGGHDREHEVEATIAALGLREPDAPCGRLSGGELRRVALARILLARPAVLLLDEPTNHLDAVATDWLEDRLSAGRETLILVTHDRYFLDRVVQRIVEIDRGRLHSYDAAYQDFLALRADRLEQEQQTERTRLNLLRRETAWMRRGPPARTTKPKARIASYQSLVAAAREEPPDGVEFQIPCGTRLGDRVIRLSGVGHRFDDRCVLAPFDLELGPRDRLGIIGPNGAGKTTLLRICTGQVEPTQGSVTVGPTVRFGMIDQGRSGLEPGQSVLAAVGRDNDHVPVDGRMVRIETFLDQFGFTGERKHTAVERLSGGERNRVLLARLLSLGGNVLVLDEPTNDLDLDTLRVLEEALVAFPGAALVVSHDRYFLDRVATRVLHLDGTGGVTLHEGDLSSLLERQRRSGGRAGEAARPSPRPARSTSPTPGPKRLSTREQEELSGLPEQIAAAEAEVRRLDAVLEDPHFYRTAGSDPHRVAAERDAAASTVERLLARWVELEERREGG